MIVTIDLPFPPSLNGNWKAGGGGIYASPRYKAWKEEAGWEIRRQKPAKIDGRFEAEMVFARPDERKRDLDNLAKPVLDALKAANVIEDDSLASRLTLAWGPIIGSTKGARISLWPFDEVTDYIRG